MKNIIFKIYHPSLDVISDRTFRNLLKSLSKTLRDFQKYEIEYLIYKSDLSPSEKQSLRDKIKAPIQHAESYYVEKIERGSLTIFALLSGAAFFILQNTVGESVKDAWKKTEFNEKLISWLSGPLNKDRKEFIDRNIDRVSDNWKFDDFLLESIERNSIDKDTLVVTLNLNTPEELSKHLAENYKKKDVEYVLNLLKKKRA